MQPAFPLAGHDDDDGESEAPSRDPAQVSGTLTVHSCFVAEPPHSELEHSGCVVVPPAVLQAATERHAAFPLVLRLAGPRAGDPACCLAPLAFTAPDGIVYVPPWVLERLAVAEGDRVRYETVALPKGTAAAFALLGRVPPFFDANTLRPQLLAALAHYPCLSVGDTVELPSSAPEHTVLEVTAVEAAAPAAAAAAGTTEAEGARSPPTSVSIVDVDLAVTIVAAAQDGSANGGGRDRVLAVGSSVRDTLAPGVSATYAVDLAPIVRVGTAAEGVVLTAAASDVACDPDLYVSLASTSPSPADFDWCDQAPGNFARVVIPLRDLPPDQQRLFVTVVSYSPEASAAAGPAAMQYEIAAEYDDDIAPIITSSSASTSEDTGDDSGSGAETVECPNCHKRVPEARATLHRVQCARYTYYCAACARCMPLSQRAKHAALCHTPRPCPLCGVPLEQAALAAHRRTACPQRPVPCPLLCGAHVPAAALAAHERTCGARTVVCAHCGLRTRWGVFARHLAHEHGIPDCVLERDVQP